MEAGDVNTLDIRWVDISIWHEEQIPVEAAADEPEEVEYITAEDIPAEDIPAEDIPAEEAPTETQLVEVAPTGPVEITVEGLSEDGSTWVYRVSEDGMMERLDAENGMDYGRVTFLTSLN